MKSKRNKINYRKETSQRKRDNKKLKESKGTKIAINENKSHNKGYVYGLECGSGPELNVCGVSGI